MDSKVNSNHEITTQKRKMKIFSPAPGFEPRSPGFEASVLPMSFADLEKLGLTVLKKTIH